MPDPTRSLPPQPSLEQQKKLARELLNAFRANDAEAAERTRTHLPDKQRITLADAQFVLAREYGFDSWAKLKRHIESAPSAKLDDTLMKQFHHAFEQRNVTELRALFDRYPAARSLINEPLFSFGSTALLRVAGQGNLDLVNLLLEYGADPNRRSDWWAGPFHVLHSARGAVAERLMEAGAIPDACGAAQMDRIDLLERMLEADPARVHERGGDGQTPLHFARSREVVDLLLARGADIDARDLDHRASAAEWMLERKRGASRYELAKYLVERGASADIFMAAALGLTDRIRELLDADPSLLDLRTGRGPYDEQQPSSFHIYTWSIGQHLSPLQVAAQFDQPDAAALLRAYASPIERFLDACVRADAAEAKQLLQQRPQLIDQLTHEQKQVLPEAGWGARTEAVALMLELGFDPAVYGSIGGTVLHCAAWEGVPATVEAALRDPRVRALINDREPKYGGTPLSWCCHGAANCGNPRADHASVARLLLDAGAQPPESLESVPDRVAAAIRDHRRA